MQYKVSQHLQTKPVRARINNCNEGIIGVILSLTLLSTVAALQEPKPYFFKTACPLLDCTNAMN